MAFIPKEELKDFPCTFNLKNVDAISRQRLQHAETNIRSDDNTLQENIIRNKNLLTWILFKLGDKNGARELNAEVLKITGRKNITALGNLIYIYGDQGLKLKARKEYMPELQKLKDQKDFDSLINDAVAEQAYCYTRLGGVQYYKLSIELLEECVQKDPKNYLRKFGLGLVYRRYGNFQCSREDEMNEMTNKFTQLLLEVGENGDDKLRGLAYAQLVVGIAGSKSWIGCEKLNINELCNKALQYGKSDPTVLTHIGRSLNKIGEDIDTIDKAIDYLKQALKLRQNSITYHHLGLCYERKHGLKQAKTLKGSSTGDLLADISNADLPANSSNSDLPANSLDGDLAADSSICDLQANSKDLMLIDAEQCYLKSIEISQEENIPARVSLGNLYFHMGDFENALAQYNQIIDKIRPGNDSSLISAHEKAGKCLNNMGIDEEEAKIHFIKAISHAAELVSLNAYYKNTNAEVWESYDQMWADVENEPPSIKKDKSKINLLHLIKKYKDIVPVVKAMFDSSPEACDVDIYRVGLESCLKSEDYEFGLLLLNISKMNASITRDDSWASPEMKKLQTDIHLAIIRDRFLNDSPDWRQALQLMYEFKYSQCLGMYSALVGEDGSADTSDTYDVLILNDDESDNEQGCDVTTILARNLSCVFRVMFGLDTSINLERNCDGGIKTDLQLKEMNKCLVLVLIIGDNDGPEFSLLQSLAHKTRAKKILVVNCQEQKEISGILKVNQMLDTNDEPWRRLLEAVKPAEQQNAREEQSPKELLDQYFNGDKQAVIDLFCLLVNDHLPEDGT